MTQYQHGPTLSNATATKEQRAALGRRGDRMATGGLGQVEENAPQGPQGYPQPQQRQPKQQVHPGPGGSEHHQLVDPSRRQSADIIVHQDAGLLQEEVVEEEEVEVEEVEEERQRHAAVIRTVPEELPPAYDSIRR